jgi:hypothetical protein
MLNINAIERLSLKNICTLLNLDYEKAKVLKKIDIIHMLNNGFTIDQELQYKQKEKMKEKPVKVKIIDDDDKTIKKKQTIKKYLASDKGKLSLTKAQKKYHDKKKQIK